MADQPSDIVRFRDPFFRRGFTQVSNELFCLTISTGAKLTYIVLCSYAWHNNECFPGQDRLASDISASVRSVRNYLVELKEAQLVTQERQGFGKPNVYYIERWLLPPN